MSNDNNVEAWMYTYKEANFIILDLLMQPLPLTPLKFLKMAAFLLDRTTSIFPSKISKQGHTSLGLMDVMYYS